MAPIAGVGNHTSGVSLKDLKADSRFDDFEIMGMDIPCLRRGSRLYHVTGRTAARPSCLRSIVVTRMVLDGSDVLKSLILTVTGEAERIVEIGHNHLVPAWASVGVMAVIT